MTNPEIQYAVINILKKQGYNAMVDEGGVGTNSTGREGYEPLIVFDSSKSLTRNETKVIDDATQKSADKEYRKWKNTTEKFRVWTKW